MGKDDHLLQVLDCRICRGRTLEAILLLPAALRADATKDNAGSCDEPSDLAVEVSDEFGNPRSVQVIEARLASKHNINLIATTDTDSIWDEAQVRVVRSQFKKWAITGEPTFYIRTTRAEDEKTASLGAALLSPVDGAPVRVKPGEKYAFEVLLAVHRCTAVARIDVEDADGTTLGSWLREVDLGKRGGTAADGYCHIEIEFTAPELAHHVCIRLEKSATASKDDSYLFIARPSLALLTGKKPSRPPLTFSAKLLKLIDEQRQYIVRIEFYIADESPEKANLPLTISIGTQGHEAIVRFLMPLSASSVDVTVVNIEHGRVRFKGTSHLPVGVSPSIGIFVDGALDAEVRPSVNAGGFRHLHQLNLRHLDGRPHTIELRLLPSHARLALDHAVLLSRITPWDSLQKYAKPPFDLAVSPSAPHHFRSMRAWLGALAGGRVDRLPPLAMLHDELLTGFRKRRDYPQIAFSAPSNPTVSIVIPAHNKFEVTYTCLCALLFAYNRTDFEVIVVDDGSTDETTCIEAFVSGLKVVRHETAMGFVHSCNDGANWATGRYIAFLNNDTEVTAGWLDELVEAIESFEGAGLVGSKLVYPDGTLQEAGGIVWSSGNPWNYGRNGNAQEPRYNYLRQVDYVSGASLLLERSLWTELGGFSTEMAPGYFEDTDLAMKVRNARRLVLYVPTSIVVHFEGQSAGTSVTSGMKRYQEVNRSKFKRKWTQIYATHGAEGVQPDREKDRNVSFRVLFIDNHFPFVDNDAGSYAAFQELRLLQSMGGKVTVLPHNLAWMDRHTLALERMGIECLYAPFVLDFADYLRQHAAEYDLIYVNRFRVAEQVVHVVRAVAPAVRIILNLADLHFLRELREAALSSPGYTYDRALETRAAELAMIKSCDLTLSYSDLELTVLRSHLDGPAALARVPWVVEPSAAPRPPFAATRDLLFLGGFGHPPNVAAVKFFAREVLPQLRERLPGIVFRVVGSWPPPEILAFASDALIVEGHVADLDEAFATARVFVVPLLAGAGIKGKVLEAMSRGCAMVASSIAVEGTGLVHGQHCLIADKPADWVETIARLYNDEPLWQQLGSAARELATTQFSFETGLVAMRDLLSLVDIYGGRGLHYRHARPLRYGRLP